MTPVPASRLFIALTLMAMLHYFLNGFTISTIYALKSAVRFLNFGATVISGPGGRFWAQQSRRVWCTQPYLDSD